MKITLPVSQITVELKESLTYRESKEIERVALSSAKNEMVSGVMSQVFDGDFAMKFTRKLIETLVVDAKDSKGEQAHINLLLDQDLDMKDGELLEEAAQKIYNDLKKK